jgi:hypothetical protein
MPKAKDITELRDQLLEIFDAAVKDPRRISQADTAANAAGKILQTLKAQMEYSSLRGEEPEIPFMGKTSGRLFKPQAKQIP